jgi:hypothetical protein
MTFHAVTLGKAKADISFKKNLEHLVKQRPLNLKEVGKLFYQYGVYLDLLEPVIEDLPVITEKELETPETTNPLDVLLEKLKSGDMRVELAPLEGFPSAQEFKDKFKIPGVTIKAEES